MKKNQTLIILLLFGLCSSIAWAQNLKSTSAIPTSPIPIWSTVGPGSESVTAVESITGTFTGDCATQNRKVKGVTASSLVPYVPANPNGTVVIICGGGAYSEISYDVEGTTIAEWLNSMNITAFILKYRLPSNGHANRWYVPLQDAQRAVRYIKSNASAWGLNANNIGIIGFSAGGHVAATLSTQYSKSVYSPIDAIDNLSAAPAFAILCYPLITFTKAVDTDGKALTHVGARAAFLGIATTDAPTQAQIDEFSAELNVTANTPKTFIAHSVKDGSVQSEGSELYYNALIAKGVSSEIHLYTSGGHGIGICKAAGTDFAKWPADCQKWLETNSFVTTIEATNQNMNHFNIISSINDDEVTIEFKLNQPQPATIMINDITGRQVNTIKQNANSGANTITFNKKELPQKGVYFITVTAGENSMTEKLIY